MNRIFFGVAIGFAIFFAMGIGIVEAFPSTKDKGGGVIIKQEEMTELVEEHTWRFTAAGFFPRHLPDAFTGKVILADLDPKTIPDEVQGVWWFDDETKKWIFWIKGARGELKALEGQGANYNVLVNGACSWIIPLQVLPVVPPVPSEEFGILLSIGGKLGYDLEQKLSAIGMTVYRHTRSDRESVRITPEMFEGYLRDPAIEIIGIYGHGTCRYMEQEYTAFTPHPTRVPWYIQSQEVWTNGYLVQPWLEARPAPRFTYLLGCETGSRTDAGSLSYAFRKGGTVGTATLSFRGLGHLTEEELASGGFLTWHRVFWDVVCEGKTFYEAMLETNKVYPLLADNVVFTGDRSVKLR